MILFPWLPVAKLVTFLKTNVSGNDSVGSTEGDTMISKESSSCNPSECFRSLVYRIRRYMSDMLM